MAKEEEKKKKRRSPVLFLLIIIVIVFFILGLAYRGYIDLSKFGLNFGNNASTNNNFVNPIQGACPMISCEAGPGDSCCGHNEANPGEIPRIVAVVLIRDACACPSDTDYLWTDTATEGGPWKHCACKNLTSS